MAKHKQEKSQPEKKNGHKPQIAPVIEPLNAGAGVTEFVGATGNGSFESRASRLGNLPKIQREAMAKKIGQAQGNHQLQRVLSSLRRNDGSLAVNTARGWAGGFDTEFSVLSPAVQRHEEEEADTDIQRQPTAGPAGATPAPSQPATVQDPTKDDAFVNKTIDAFSDDELKKQIGTSIKNRRDFLQGMQQYLGTLDDVINHFKEIELVSEVPGEVHLHKKAADRLRMVAKKLGPEGVPGTTVALGLRDRYHPHLHKGPGLMAHPCGFAIDFRAEANPHITDPRLVKLLAMRTGGATAMNLGNYKTRRSIIKRMGQQMAKGGIDPNSELGKEATAFQTQLEDQYNRVSAASKSFQAELKDTRAELMTTYNEIKRIDREITKINKLKKQKKKKGGKTLEELNQEAQELRDQKQQLKDKVRPELPRLFKPWLEQLDKEMQGIEAQIKAVLPTGNTAALPSKQELLKQEKEVTAQLRQITTMKKQAEAAIRKLKAQIEAEKRRKSASEKRIAAWDDAITKAQAGVPGRTPTATDQQRIEKKVADLTAKKSAEEKEIAARDASVTKLGEDVAKQETILTQQGTAETAAQQTRQLIQKQKDLLPQISELKNMQSLKQSLSTDTEFVFEGKESVSDPAIGQLLEKGFFNPDPDRKPGEKFDSDKHGFNLLFLKTMAEHGFELAAAWNPQGVDPMHLELVEGVESIRDVLHPPKQSIVNSAAAPAAPAPVAPQAPQQKQQVQPKRGSDVVQRYTTSETVTARQGLSPASVKSVLRQKRPGPNAGPRWVGGINRIPVKGLKLGNQSVDTPSDKEFEKLEGFQAERTSESARGWAVALIPKAVFDPDAPPDPKAATDKKTPVDVILHLHGWGVGYRLKSGSKKTRDEAVDKTEEQLESSGRNMIAVLPQGSRSSGFGDGFDSDSYLAEVFNKLHEMRCLPERITPGRVVLTGHSGGGNTVYAMLKHPSRLPQNLAELVLFDAIQVWENKKTKKMDYAEVEAVQNWLTENLNNDLSHLKNTKVNKSDYLKTSPRFRGYYTANYASQYQKVDATLTAWFDNHEVELGGKTSLSYTGLRENYRVIDTKLSGDEHNKMMGLSGGLFKDALGTLDKVP